MKLIDLHKEWAENCKIDDRINSNGNGGLCNAIPEKYMPALALFEPESPEIYWASESGYDALYGYNAIRQTIVLFICAMNNEL